MIVIVINYKHLTIIIIIIKNIFKLLSFPYQIYLTIDNRRWHKPKSGQLQSAGYKNNNNLILADRFNDEEDEIDVGDEADVNEKKLENLQNYIEQRSKLNSLGHQGKN